LPGVQPETRYAKSGDLSVAYQVVGEGPLDLVLVPGWASNLDASWEAPDIAHLWRRYAAYSRLILFDKRGTGLSDPVVGAPTLEQRMDDVRAVMDAAGSERAALVGVSEGGPMSLLFAATYPERAIALVLYGSAARFSRGDDYPWGWSQEWVTAFAREIDEAWGRGALLDIFAPSVATDEKAREWWAHFQRQAASPAMARALMKAVTEIDTRAILPAIRIPTLVIHRSGERVVPVGCARYLAQHIPGARLVELPGIDHLPIIDGDAIMDEIEEFLTGVRPLPESDRVLATVLFTDIVTSTERSAQVGDRRWKDLLDQHDTLIRRELERHRGRLVKNTGDGILATFDGPARAIRCAQAIATSVKALGIEVRAGLHTGEVELRGEDVTGMGVNIAARVMDAAGPGGVVVSSTVKDLVAGSGLRFADRGTHDLRGVPGEWRLFAVEG
jgi:class 3 adenylate cyclase/pimeloyl-ACP methyl ester carboxylesterase